MTAQDRREKNHIVSVDLRKQISVIDQLSCKIMAYSYTVWFHIFYARFIYIFIFFVGLILMSPTTSGKKQRTP